MSLLSLSLLLTLLSADPPGSKLTSRLETSILVAGRHFEVGRQVVLWNDEQGFDGYRTRCVEQSGGCCEADFERYGVRKGLRDRTVEGLREIVSQFILHFDGCVNSRSCFKSMHNRPRPGGGCGLSAHFMIDADGTIYQTLDLAERAYHAEQENSLSIGVEICNRGRYNPDELSRLPEEYRTRPHRDVVINGYTYNAYDFRPEQYESLIALTRTLLRIFPKIKAQIPEKNGEVLLDTLDAPTTFQGILGHLHVDLQKQKWDPGSFDWKRLLRALRGFVFPIQIRAFSEVPRTRNELLTARKAAYFGAEERVTAFFPISSSRLWHSGIHLRGRAGMDVFAPTRGRLIAARRDQNNKSSNAFVLLRHDVDVAGNSITFYSLLMHLHFPPLSDHNRIPWMQSLMQSHMVHAKTTFQSGAITLLDERIETGDLVGYLGQVQRGPEQGSELHFEIFTADKLPAELERNFRYFNAVTDGPIVRRRSLVSLFDKNGDGQITNAELKAVFQHGDLKGKQSLRRMVVRHRHEWGNRTTSAEFLGFRELSGISSTDRQTLFSIAIEPYIFWTDALSLHAGLPLNQIIYSYHPITFLLMLGAELDRLDLTWPHDSLPDGSMEPRRLSMVPILDWTQPTQPMSLELKLPPLIGTDLKTKRRDAIPLIELSSTDHR
jgi:N-acetylmuramoyl-L-alanine amidase